VLVVIANGGATCGASQAVRQLAAAGFLGSLSSEELEHLPTALMERLEATALKPGQPANEDVTAVELSDALQVYMSDLRHPADVARWATFALGAPGLGGSFERHGVTGSHLDELAVDATLWKDMGLVTSAADEPLMTHTQQILRYRLLGVGALPNASPAVGAKPVTDTDAVADRARQSPVGRAALDSARESLADDAAAVASVHWGASLTADDDTTVPAHGVLVERRSIAVDEAVVCPDRHSCSSAQVERLLVDDDAGGVLGGSWETVWFGRLVDQHSAPSTRPSSGVVPWTVGTGMDVGLGRPHGSTWTDIVDATRSPLDDVPSDHTDDTSAVLLASVGPSGEGEVVELVAVSPGVWVQYRVTLWSLLGSSNATLSAPMRLAPFHGEDPVVMIPPMRPVVVATRRLLSHEALPNASPVEKIGPSSSSSPKAAVPVGWLARFLEANEEWLDSVVDVVVFGALSVGGVLVMFVVFPPQWFIGPLRKRLPHWVTGHRNHADLVRETSSALNTPVAQAALEKALGEPRLRRQSSVSRLVSK
jgi:hypothetical protein